MKNLIRILFFVGILILLLPSLGQAQEITGQTGGDFFSKIGSWVTGSFSTGIIWFIGGILSKGGYTLFLKKIAKKTKEVSVQLSEFFGDLGVFADKVDSAIKDNGDVIPNSVMEAFEAGKHVVVEGKDVIMTIKPKS